MFAFKNQDCEKKKHLSDGRQLEEINKELGSGGAASGGFHCLAEQSNWLRMVLLENRKTQNMLLHKYRTSLLCANMCCFRSCASFFLLRDKEVCGK